MQDRRLQTLSLLIVLFGLLSLFESAVSLTLYIHQPHFLSGSSYVAFFLLLYIGAAAMVMFVALGIAWLLPKTPLGRQAGLVLALALFTIIYMFPIWFNIFSDNLLSSKAQLAMGALAGAGLMVGVISALLDVGWRAASLTARRIVILAFIGLAIIVTGWAASIEAWQPEPFAVRYPEPEAFDLPETDTIVILTFDALRADHLSAYGYARQTSPELDLFMADALRFSNARATRASTAPSLTSMLTGLYPTRHGLIKNGWTLSDEVQTLPKLLPERFTTAAFVANPIVGPSVEVAGFDQTQVFNHSEASVVIEAAEDWLKEQKGRPVFLWVHLFEPHSPYLDSDGVVPSWRGDPLYDVRQRNEYSYPAAAKALKMEYRGTQDDERISEAVNEKVAAYDASIRSGSRHAASFLEWVMEIRKDPFIIVTSDHGESMVEHDYFFFHGVYTYDTALRIPLALRFDAANLKGITGRPASLVDILPTVCLVARCRHSEKLDGLGLLTTDPGASRDIFMASDDNPLYLRRSLLRDNWKMHIAPDRRFAPLDGIVHRRSEILGRLMGVTLTANPYRFKVYHEEIYDLDEDTMEMHDLSHIQQERVSQMTSDLLRFLDQQFDAGESNQTSPQDVTPEMQEHLRALGYLE